MVSRRIAHYEIIELLGIGGAAEVHRALDLTTHQEIALKLLSERAEPEMILRFVREGQALLRMEHPHVVRVHDMGQQDGQRYLAMDLMTGASLKERLQGGAMPWRDALTVAKQIAEALAYAHDQGVVHRDIKPGNIMFAGDGACKLADFGLAHLDDLSAMTRTGTVMGTVFYLSPEQAVGKHVDGRSDLFALGSVLYEMLVGQPPFTGPSAVSIIYKILNQEHTPLREVDPTLPIGVQRVVDRLLAKEIDLRYQDGAKVAAALAALLEEDGKATAIAIDGQHGEATASETPFVGRTAELDQLVQAMDSASRGAGCAMMLAGEAGIGKTRLVQELRRAAEDRNVLVLQGDCLYVDAPNPYAPFSAMLNSYQGQVTADPDETELAEVLDQARALLVGYGEGADPTWVGQASLQDAQSLAFELVTRLWELVSRSRPLVLVVDDMHWASPTTLQLFHHLTRSLRAARIMIVGTYRPEDVLADENGAHDLIEMLRRMSREGLYQEIALAPLDEHASAELVDETLGAADVPDEFIGQVSASAEGNPFALLETLRLMQDQGVLAESDGVWALTQSPDRIAVPSSVADIILRRADRLDDEDRELVEWASVLGERFNVEVLAEMAELRRFRLVRRLSQLERNTALILADDEGFRFQHARTRQALYDAMPAFMRTECHLMAGEIIEGMFEGYLGAHVYELAHHYHAGHDSSKGFKFSRQAAQFAQQTYALTEASTYAQMALNLLDDAGLVEDAYSVRVELTKQLADLSLTTGDMDDSKARYQNLLAVAEAHNATGVISDALHGLASVAGRQGDWDHAVAHDLMSYQTASVAEDHEKMAQALLSMGFFRFEQGDWAQARESLAQAAEIAMAHDKPLYAARAWGNSAIMLDARGDKVGAIEYYSKSLETFASLGRELDMARGYNNLGFAHYGAGDLDQAMSCYNRAVELAAKLGDVREQAIAHLHSAEARLKQGDIEASRGACREASRRFERVGFELGGADVDRVYAGIARLENRLAVAERYLRGALAVYEAYGDQLNVAETRAELAEVLEIAGQGQGAQDELHRSRAIWNDLLGHDEDASTN